MPRLDRVWSAQRPMLLDMTFLAVLWVIAIAIVDPRGEFPINDDWVYFRSVSGFAAGDGFDPGPLTTAALLSHVLWGAAVCAGVTCSYEALRIAGLFWGLAGMLATYLLVWRVGAGRSGAFVAAMSLGFNPIYLVSAGSFMTDVPFVVAITVACLFFVRALESQSWLDVNLGTLAACFATMSRQIGIAVPLAFCGVLLSRTLRAGEKQSVTVAGQAFAPLAVCVGAFIVLQQWQAANGRVPKGREIVSRWLRDALSSPAFIHALADQLTISAPYIGWFLLPVLLHPAILRKALMPAGWMRVTAIAAGALAAVATLWTIRGIGRSMPIYWNMIVPQGIGPLTLHDSYPPGARVLGGGDLPPLSGWFWGLVTAAGVCGAALLIWRLAPIPLRVIAAPRRISREDEVGLFLLGATILYLVPSVIILWFDRYLLPVVPLLAAAAAVAGVRSAVPNGPILRGAGLVGLAFLMMTSCFTILATADYMAWNRVRWAAINDLLASGKVRTDEIDGGYEFNGSNFFDVDYKPQPGKSYWWVVGDDYVITFGRMPGRRIVKEYRYPSWFHRGDNRIYVLARDRSDSPRK